VAAQYVCGLRHAAQLKRGVCKVRRLCGVCQFDWFFLCSLTLSTLLTPQRDEAITLLKKQLRRASRSTVVAATAEAEAAAAAVAAAAAGAVNRSSKLRLYVTLPDGACAGVLASPLMPVRPCRAGFDWVCALKYNHVSQTPHQVHELKRQVLPDLLSALPQQGGRSSTALRYARIKHKHQPGQHLVFPKHNVG